MSGAIPVMLAVIRLKMTSKAVARMNVPGWNRAPLPVIAGLPVGVYPSLALARDTFRQSIPVAVARMLLAG